jgi:hypothetical protein
MMAHMAFPDDRRHLFCRRIKENLRVSMKAARVKSGA